MNVSSSRPQRSRFPGLARTQERRGWPAVACEFLGPRFPAPARPPILNSVASGRIAPDGSNINLINAHFQFGAKLFLRADGGAVDLSVARRWHTRAALVCGVVVRERATGTDPRQSKRAPSRER